MRDRSAASRQTTESHDAAAFMSLVRSNDRELRMLAYRILQDRSAMDDVMQEAYLKAFRGYAKFRGDAGERTWLYRIVYNACLDRLRSDRRRRGREVPLDQTAGAGCVDGCAAAYRGPRAAELAAIDRTETVIQRSDLTAALASLPEDQRAAVLLVDAAGFSYEETAEVLGARPGTIGSRLHHARSVLREALAEGSGHEAF